MTEAGDYVDAELRYIPRADGVDSRSAFDDSRNAVVSESTSAAEVDKVDGIADSNRRVGNGAEKMLLCPECDEPLPVTEVTECSYCGAWLTLQWRIDAPSQFDNE